MSELFKYTSEQRAQAFLTAQELHPLGLPAYIIEKDFWVTQTLKILYMEIAPELKEKCEHPFIFKGGTSLSKCFNVINRMSEDIDLSFSLDLLGQEKVVRQEGIGRKKRLEEALEIDAHAQQYIKESLYERLEKRLHEIEDRVSLEIESETPLNIAIYYPKELEEKEYGTAVRPRVLLETGGRSDNTPTEIIPINHMLSDCLDAFEDELGFEVVALSPKRTMLEKMFGVHTNLTQKKKQPKYARHLYDILKLHEKDNEYYKDSGLFFEHVEFSDIHYKTHEESCITARSGPIKLIPVCEEMNSHYKSDWESMADMFPNGELPYQFEQLIEEVRELQQTVNELYYSQN
ncbi:nucleotidyl transferase AbiEii/AbiGii toxin family protein [Vibrio cyclitrophicus]|uniref:nucleotidyl transferase AbiEii/AbiGii toxin family protein n=1 Tax=Vibrio cyclitrophicus TaxID=47951 RepID=UPI000C821A42|nr:nucleotidyl transferase AbiEii/AbiGii toxin family protein [Vibrio cyclitrophicus]PMF55280.1 hypothetical protein BCV12_01940 [Vibrio cyclitrophicus]